jgi:putative phage-type endonuclease
MIVYDEIIQGSEEWLQVRAGKFTGSKASDLFAGKTTATYQNLINKIVSEKVIGKTAESGYKSEAMQRGSNLESEARENFELNTFVKVGQVGFIELSENIGISPDGLIDDEGLLEIKCPITTTQISYLVTKKIPKDYFLQMQFQMMVTGRKYCFFHSYHPELSPLTIKVERDEKVIEEIKAELITAIQTVNERVKIVKGIS